MREMTLLKSRCDAQLGEAEYLAERAVRALQEAQQQHEGRRAAADASKARLDAAVAARAQTEAELARLGAEGGAEPQQAQAQAEAAAATALRQLEELRAVCAAAEGARARRMAAERQLEEAQAGGDAAAAALAADERRLAELRAQLAALRAGGAPGGNARRSAQLAALAGEAGALAGEVLAQARAEGVLAALHPALAAFVAHAASEGAPASFAEDWREWEEFPDAGWTLVQQAGPAPAAAAPLGQSLGSGLPSEPGMGMGMAPPPLPVRSSLEAPRAGQLQQPAGGAQDTFAGGLGSPGGLFGSSHPPSALAPPPPPPPPEDDFFGGGAFGGAPPPPKGLGPEAWAGF